MLLRQRCSEPSVHGGKASRSAQARHARFEEIRDGSIDQPWPLGAAGDGMAHSETLPLCLGAWPQSTVHMHASLYRVPSCHLGLEYNGASDDATASAGIIPVRDRAPSLPGEPRPPSTDGDDEARTFRTPDEWASQAVKHSSVSRTDPDGGVIVSFVIPMG